VASFLKGGPSVSRCRGHTKLMVDVAVANDSERGAKAGEDNSTLHRVRGGNSTRLRCEDPRLGRVNRGGTSRQSVSPSEGVEGGNSGAAGERSGREDVTDRR
jgi:hypothetical protein